MNQRIMSVVAALSIATCSASPTLGGEPKLKEAREAVLSVGMATCQGDVHLEIEIWTDDNPKDVITKEMVEWRATIPQGTEGTKKASIIMETVPPKLANVTIVQVKGEDKELTNKISVVSNKVEEQIWYINSIKISSEVQGTNEVDVFHLYNASGKQIDTGASVCSIKGKAEGKDSKGAPGKAKCTFRGKNATVYTFPGMTAQQVEREMILQFKAQGVPARWVTTDDQLAENHPTLVGDGVAFIIEGPGHSDGFAIDIKDVGLALDVGAIFDNGEFPCLALSVDQLVAGSLTNFLLEAGTPGQRAVTVYGTADGTTLVNGFADYCASFGIRGVNPDTVLGGFNRIFDANGEITFALPIPNGISGLRILFQSAQHGTCPDNCMSNVLDLVVQ